jgi:VWFA-related protein
VTPQIIKNYCVFAICVICVALVPQPWRVSTQAQQSTDQRPVFRGGAHFVSVDAYPTRDGKIVEGLSKDDFDVYEDDKPQKIETFEYISADARPPDDERSTMLTPREGLELAADPRYRVFVIVIDRTSMVKATWEPMRRALHEFLDTEVSPRDLIGLITTDKSWQDLVIGQRLSAIEEEIDGEEWLREDPTEEQMVLEGCNFGPLRVRARWEATYGLLESLVRVLGQVREDHSSIVFVSNNLSRQPNMRDNNESQPLSLPKTSLVNGRITRASDDMHEHFCKSEAARLMDMNFDQRFTALTTAARAANVSFYPIRMPPLVADFLRTSMPTDARRTPPPVPMPAPSMADDNLGDLAKKTAGFPAGTGDGLAKGLRRIAQDVGAHYLLGYYTTNESWDGKIRKITVRLKPKGTQIAARHEYRAPTRAEMEALSATHDVPTNARSQAVADALGALSHIRPSAQFFAYGAIADKTMTVAIEVPPEAVDAGRFGEGGALELIADTAAGDTVGTATSRLLPNGRALVAIPLDGSARPSTLFVRLRADGEAITERVALAANASTLAGDPVLYRSGPRGTGVPAASFLFTKQDRIRLEWALNSGVEQFDVRLLDQFGHPLLTHPDVKRQDTSAGFRLVAEQSLAPLGRGDYVVELTLKAGGKTEQKLTAFRVR